MDPPEDRLAAVSCWQQHEDETDVPSMLVDRFDSNKRHQNILFTCDSVSFTDPELQLGGLVAEGPPS